MQKTDIHYIGKDPLILAIINFFTDKDNIKIDFKGKKLEDDQVSWKNIETQGDVVTVDVIADLDTEQVNQQYKREEGKQYAYDIKYKLEQYLQTNFAFTPLSIIGVNVIKENNKDVVKFEISFIYMNKGNNKDVSYESVRKEKKVIKESKFARAAEVIRNFQSKINSPEHSKDKGDILFYLERALPREVIGILERGWGEDALETRAPDMPIVDEYFGSEEGLRKIETKVNKVFQYEPVYAESILKRAEKRLVEEIEKLTGKQVIYEDVE